MATEPQKAKPLPDRQDLDTGEFWNGTDRGELQVKRCGACSRYHWPPRLGCPHCGAGELKWEAVSPKGKVFSWTVVHRSQTPGFEPEVPYAVILVELDDAPGVRMVGNLRDCAPERISPSMPVEGVFTPSADGSVKLVNWRPKA